MQTGENYGLQTGENSGLAKQSHSHIIYQALYLGQISRKDI